MRTEIEDGMGCAGLVPTKAERSSEDAFRREHVAYEQMQSKLTDEIARLNGVIREAHAKLSPMYYSPIPSLTAIRDVVDTLRRANSL